MNIHSPTSQDFPQIQSIYSLYFPDPKDLNHHLDRVKSFLENSDSTRETHLQYLVAEEDGKIEGVLGFRDLPEKMAKYSSANKELDSVLQRNDKKCKPLELYTLFIAKRKSGTGKALVNKMKEIVKESGYTEVIVFSANRWQENWPFYDSIGFTRIESTSLADGREGQVWRMDL